MRLFLFTSLCVLTMNSTPFPSPLERLSSKSRGELFAMKEPTWVLGPFIDKGHAF